MKIYNKVVLDLNGKVIEEDSFDYIGPLELSAGGGGSGAGNDTPDYLKDAHHQILTGDHTVTTDNNMLNSKFMLQVMTDIIETDVSPYNGETSYDPDSDLTAALVETAEFDDEVDAMVTVDDFETRHDAAVVKADNDFAFSSMATSINLAVASATAALGEAAITAAVTAYRNSVEAGLATRLSQLSGGAADINAVHSSAFILAEAIIDAEVEKNISVFESQIKLELFKDTLKAQLETIVRKRLARDQYISQAVSEMNRLALAKLESFKSSAILSQEYYKLKLVTKKEENRENLEMDVQDAMWDMNIFQAGANVLAAGFGASTMNKNEMSPFQSGISGLASGAAAGAAIGSVVPGVGTLAGAIGGGTLGLLGGLFG